jgi:hypothetical protein
MAIRTTLIVGYPGETEEDFQLLKNWVEEMRFERLGCFTYSHEENTHAFNLVDDVPEEVKQARAAEIMDIQAQISWELNQEKIGQTFKCVIDRKEGQYFIGRTEFDSPDVDNEVLVDASKHYLKTGDFVNIKITDATNLIYTVNHNYKKSADADFFIYKGIFPCFRLGVDTSLFSNIANAFINFLRVSFGKITSSIKPLCAAVYGLANKSAYSFSFSRSFASGFSASLISFLNIISEAPLLPLLQFRQLASKIHISSNVL